MASRHGRQTGRRAIFTNGAPQMRQSEGNKTAKRLSAIWEEAFANSEVSNHGGTIGEAIEGPATAALASAARIRSPLLLKTASLMPARIGAGRARLPLP